MNNSLEKIKNIEASRAIVPFAMVAAVVAGYALFGIWAAFITIILGLAITFKSSKDK